MPSPRNGKCKSSHRKGLVGNRPDPFFYGNYDLTWWPPRLVDMEKFREGRHSNNSDDVGLGIERRK